MKTAERKQRVRNVYLSYAAARTAKFINNRKVQKQIESFQSIDSIQNFSLFSEKIQPLIKTKTVNRFVYPNAENTMYGHLQSLYRYAGINYKRTPLIHMEHGVNFAVEEISDFKLDHSTVMIFQSDYKKAAIHQKAPNMPVFAIGPYVQYAVPYYDQQRFDNAKDKLGKTVVIYLSHTWEKVSIQRDFEEYARIIDRYSEEFDSIMFCLYWSDCSSELVSWLQQYKNVHIVSAGFRGDPNFLSRTRTILELADLVAGNDIGTYVGYALCLGKKVEYIRTNERIDNQVVDGKTLSISRQNKQRVVDALESGNDEQIKAVYNEFWGGDCIRSKAEISEILLLADKIGRASLGFNVRFSLCAKKVINKVENVKDKETARFLMDSVFYEEILDEADVDVAKIKYM